MNIYPEIIELFDIIEKCDQFAEISHIDTTRMHRLCECETIDDHRARGMLQTFAYESG